MNDTPEMEADGKSGAVAGSGAAPPEQAGSETEARAERAAEKRIPRVEPGEKMARRRGAGTTLGLLALLAAGGLGWLYLQQQNTVTGLQRELQALQAQNSGSGDALAALERSLQAQAAESQQQVQQQLQQALDAGLQSATTRLAAQDEQLATLRRELTGAMLRITDSGAGASRDWLLAEASSLLRLARQRLLTARDVRAAIGLYLSTDDILKQLNDPAVFAVREVLARELSQLQGLPEVDIPGIYARLGALAQRIDDFSVVDEAGTDMVFDAPAGTDGAADGAGWLASAAATLDRYFVVSRRDDAVTPLLSAEQQQLIRRAIQLQFEQARVALLRGQQSVYERALDEARAAIEARLQGPAGAREGLLEGIASLRGTPIQVDIPPLDATLGALRQLQPLPENAQ